METLAITLIGVVVMVWLKADDRRDGEALLVALPEYQPTGRETRDAVPCALASWCEARRVKGEREAVRGVYETALRQSLIARMDALGTTGSWDEHNGDVPACVWRKRYPEARQWLWLAQAAAELAEG